MDAAYLLCLTSPHCLPGATPTPPVAHRASRQPRRLSDVENAAGGGSPKWSVNTRRASIYPPLTARTQRLKHLPSKRAPQGHAGGSDLWRCSYAGLRKGGRHTEWWVEILSARSTTQFPSTVFYWHNCHICGLIRGGTFTDATSFST